MSPVDTEQLRCENGHSWDWTVKPGTAPLRCPEHTRERKLAQSRTAARRRYRELTSDPVRRAAHWAAGAASHREAEARRRARRAGVWVEKVSHAAVFDRDEWVCHLCRLPIPRGLSFPDPDSASIDHVAPLALGGEHSYRNIKAAHLWCNIHKGARPAREEVGL